MNIIESLTFRRKLIINGKAYFITIPRVIARALNMTRGDVFDIGLDENGRIIIRLIRPEANEKKQS